MTDAWLPSLITETPDQGFALAVKLSRMAVKLAQPSDEVRARLRSDYEHNADSLIALSQVVAANFATVAAANGYWREARIPAGLPEPEARADVRPPERHDRARVICAGAARVQLNAGCFSNAFISLH